MDNQDVGIRFNENDRELFNAIKQQFPNCQLLPIQELEGIEILWVAIIPAAGFALQLLDFLFTHVIPKKDEEKQKDPSSAKRKTREILYNGKVLKVDELVGKSDEEAMILIKTKLGLEIDINKRTE